MRFAVSGRRVRTPDRGRPQDRSGERVRECIRRTEAHHEEPAVIDGEVAAESERDRGSRGHAAVNPGGGDPGCREEEEGLRDLQLRV